MGKVTGDRRMSFDLFVFVPQLPADLARRWEQMLPELGLVVCQSSIEG